MDQALTAPDIDPGVLQARIRQLGGAARFLVAADHDMAAEVEQERERLRRLLADSGVAPELTVADCVELLQAVLGALDVPAVNGDKAASGALLVQRAGWARATVQGFLDGKQDAHFAASFLTKQTARLQPGAVLGPPPDQDA